MRLISFVLSPLLLCREEGVVQSWLPKLEVRSYAHTHAHTQSLANREMKNSSKLEDDEHDNDVKTIPVNLNFTEILHVSFSFFIASSFFFPWHPYPSHRNAEGVAKVMGG